CWSPRGEETLPSRPRASGVKPRKVCVPDVGRRRAPRARVPAGRSTGARELSWVGPFGQPRLGETLPGGVVEQDAVFVPGPEGVGLDQARALDVEEQAAGPAGANQQLLAQGRLARVELVVPAEGVQDVAAEGFEGGQGQNSVHAWRGGLGPGW